MKNQKHTSGPWLIYKIKRSKGHGIMGASEANVTEGVPVPKLADARLIAAAPELLEALESLSTEIKALREGKRDGGTMGSISMADDRAREIIKKAKGES